MVLTFFTLKVVVIHRLKVQHDFQLVSLLLKKGRNSGGRGTAERAELGLFLALWLVVLPVPCPAAPAGGAAYIRAGTRRSGWVIKQSTLAAGVIWQLLCDTDQNCFPTSAVAVLLPEWGGPSPGLLYTHSFLLYTQSQWCSALLDLRNTKLCVLHNKHTITASHVHCFVSFEDNPCFWVQSPYKQKPARPMDSWSTIACIFQVLIFWLQEELCVS